MMRIKIKISRENLKQNAFCKSTQRKLKTNNVDKGNAALVNTLIYIMLLKERNQKC